MITAIVFSKDRPMQLDCLLSSLERHAPGVFDVTVLFKPSNGYRRCQDLHLDWTQRWGLTLRWLSEQNFRDDTLTLIDRATERICFFCDDDMMHSAMPPSPEILTLAPDWAAFSLRLGVLTDHCYPHDAPQSFPADTEAHHFGLTWRWREGNGDTSYPLSLDGHVMETSVVRDILTATDFSNPNEMEDRLAWAANHTAALARRPLMACAPMPCVVGIPANVVTATHANRHADKIGYSPEYLNERFLDGYRIAWEEMDFSNVRAAHAEIPYVFRRQA